MAHEIETMAWVAERPWHGLGVEVPQGISTEDMLKAAGLDWRVEKSPMTAKMSDGRIIDVPTSFALVRDTDASVLSICGTDYTPIQNNEIFEFFNSYCKTGAITMETAGSLRNGRQVWGLGRVKNSGFTVGKNDRVEHFLLFSQPHEYGKAWTIKLTSIRVVCQNTMTVALAHGDATARGSHVGLFSAAAAKVKDTLASAKKLIQAQEAEAKLLSETQAPEADALRYVAEFFQPDLLGIPEPIVANINPYELKRLSSTAYNAINDSPGADMAQSTWWGALNAVTYTVDHVVGNTQDNRLHRAWFGDGAQLKQRAYGRALQYARNERAVIASDLKERYAVAK